MVRAWVDRRPVLRPSEHLFQALFFALGHELDGAVRPVADPARQAETLRLALRRRAEVNAGHATSNDQVEPLRSHRGSRYRSEPALASS